ncbi:MAG TPA: leucine-rich repeat protein [Candidatus Acidoferrum sp.]|nr:leucine-rich repeat protein [Candidatus Acidoferrum sp.]
MRTQKMLYEKNAISGQAETGKKLLAVLLTAAVLFTLLPTTAFAANGDTGTTADGFKWKEWSGGASITGYTGSATEINIPDTIDNNGTNLTVMEISSSAFSGNNTITAVTFPESLLYFGMRAFYQCTGLTSINIPAAVAYIEEQAFCHCTSINAVTFGAGSKLIEIGGGAFADTAITSISIPNGVTTINDGAFQDCTELTSINIPSGVTRIKDSAFQGCASLTSISIPNGVTSIGNSAFQGCTELTSINIPSGVTTINDSAFQGCASLTSISIPNGVTSIGNSAFQGCTKLTSITIPSDVTSIGNSAFQGCTELTSINIPIKVNTIGDSTFEGCTKLATVGIDEDDLIYAIGSSAFKGCTALTSITIPEYVNTIGNSAFSGCTNLASVNIVGNTAVLLTIGGSAFQGCTALTSITIPSSVTSISDSAFQDCTSLVKATVSSKTAAFGNSVFDDTALDSDGMYGYKHSTADTYCTTNSIPFHYLTDGETVITTTSLPNGTISVPYSQTLARIGNASSVTWSIDSGSLPDGLSLDAGTGVISGTPTVLGPFTFTVKAVNSIDAGDSDTQELTITIISGFAGGDGTSGDPYLIETAEQLDRVRNFLGAAYKDTYFWLTAPIDLSSYANWVPIGDMANPFCGHIYGTEYDSETETYIYQTISKLSINRPDEDYVGLFGYCSGADIGGIAIRNADVTGGNAVGALVGQTVNFLERDTMIGYCSATGTVTAVNGYAAGGLVGMATDTQITQSYSTASVTGTMSNAGGLVGYLNNGSIRNCYATGPVTSTGTDNYAGGLVGLLYSADCEIYYCYAAGKVTGEGETGGIVGHSNTNDIRYSYFNIGNAGSSDNGSKGIGVNTINLIYQSSFEDWDFDIYFSEIWRIDPGASYPYLRLNEQIPHPAPPAATSARIVDESGDSRYNAATKTLTMTYGGVEASLSAEDVTPADGLVMWSSSDTAVTDIWWGSSGDIHIEAKGAGTATVSLQNSDGSTLDSITVIVEPVPLMVNGEFKVENKVYDGSANACIINTTLSLDTSNCIGDDASNLTANFAATFSDPDAGQDKAVSLSASTLAGSAAGNYVLDLASVPTTTAAITPKELTIGGSFTAQSKAYDGTTNAVIASNNLTLVGRVGSDDVTLFPVLAFDTPDIATGKTVSLTAGSYLTGAKAANYTLSISGAPIYTSGVITNKQATLGGSFTVDNKEYTGVKAATIASNNLTLIGVNSGDDVSIASVTAEFDSAAVGSGTVRITDVTLTGTNAGDYSVSFTGAPTATANITAKPLTITGSFTAHNKVYDGSTDAVIDANALTLVGVLGGDDVTLNAVAAFADKNANAIKTVTLTGSTLTGDNAANYTLDFTNAPTTTADIMRATGLQAPAAPTLQSKTSTSVTLTPNAEQEFSKDNGTTWQTSNVFTGLTPSTQYSFVTRIKGDANHEASPASVPLTVTTDAPSSTGGGSSGGSGNTSSNGRFEITSSFVSNPNSGKTLTLGNDFASVTIPSNMLDSIPGVAGKKAEIIIGQGDKSKLPDDVKAAIGDRPLISLSLLIDGKQTDWNNPSALVTVSIPYTPRAAELENPESIVIWYIDGSGNAVCVPNGHYDPATGTVTFSTTHFSLYAAGYNMVSFNDVASTDWYYKAVSFIAARGITTGTGNGLFSPDAVLTRADFLVMLMRAYGIAPDTSPADNFSDAGNNYYTGYLAAAKRLGISAGVGNNMYAPGKEITRQEMFTLLYNALKVIGRLPQGDSGKTFSDFSDAGQIDSWAKEALTLLVKTGTVGGNGGKLNPTGTTTRAEMAQVLYNMLGK